jgi:ribosomal-protein-alanine N-acetyltransferase
MTTVRPATREDLGRCRAIQAAALSDPWPDLLPTALESGAVFLVIEGDRPAGYAVAFACPGAVAYVPEIAVKPERQGAGLGTRLLRAMLDRLAATGHNRVRLTVRADDERARGFYEARGFEPVERREGQFDDADGLLLERDRIGTDDSC